MLPKAAKQNVGIIVRLPLASGLLSGKWTRTTRFAADDHRNFNADGKAFNVGETFSGLPFEKGVELVDELKQAGAQGHAAEPVRAALDARSAGRCRRSSPA